MLEFNFLEQSIISISIHSFMTEDNKKLVSLKEQNLCTFVVIAQKLSNEMSAFLMKKNITKFM